MFEAFKLTYFWIVVMSVKRSYGIACCKPSSVGVHLIMIKKRFTYAYFDFIFGKYDAKDIRGLKELFSRMTYWEKMLIMEGDFNNMWNRLMNTNKNIRLAPRSDIESCYPSKKQRFESLFRSDQRKLREVLNNTAIADSIWELPKGHPIKGEKPIDTAIREFREETGGTLADYDILYDCPPITQTYKSGKNTHIITYFLAVAHSNWIPKLDFSSYEQTLEVECVRLVPLEQVKFLNAKQVNYKRMIDLATRTVALFKKHRPQWSYFSSKR